MEIHGTIPTPLALPVFGEIETSRVLALDDLFAVVSDKFPVSPGHTLIIARRPVARFRDLTAAEKARLLVWIGWTQENLVSRLSPAPGAFNLGVNDGQAAGQTMAQFHFHVIPRYAGDVPDPRGGVRHVIPTKANYWSQPSKATKPDLPLRELSGRTKRCLTAAGIPAERRAVLEALKTGALSFRTTLYGKYTHRDVCRWLGIEESFRPLGVPIEVRPFVENGLSYRANGVLGRAGIPAEKAAVRDALESGALVPGKRPYNYGARTHAELRRWAASQRE